MNPTSPLPRPLSEADQLDCYLEKRDTWLQTQDRGTQCAVFNPLFGGGPNGQHHRNLGAMAGGGFDHLPSTLICFVAYANLMSFAGRQKDIRPDAPWLEFLDVRYRLLVAYQRHERGRRESKKSPTAERVRVELRTAFLQLSGALDQVTVPVEYWSERPHEKLEGEQNHASMLANLNALIRVLESLAAAERDGDAQRVVVERMMREQTKILEEQRRFASPSRSRASSPPASTSIHFRPEPVAQS